MAYRNNYQLIPYVQQYGGSISDSGLAFYRPNLKRQHGFGIGGIFGSIARRLIPWAREVLFPAAKKYIIPHAQQALKNFAGEVLKGENVKQSLKANSLNALKGMGDQILNQSGSGRRRRKKRVKAVKAIRVAQKKKIRKIKKKPVKRKKNKRKLSKKRKSNIPRFSIWD